MTINLEKVMNVIRIAVLLFVIVAGALIVIQAYINPARVTFGY